MAVASTGKSRKKFTPGCDAEPEEIFDFPFLMDSETCKFLLSHGRIMLIIRGPPGTAKNTLSNLIKEHYPSSVFCSADNYFGAFCVDKIRNRETLKASHNYCKKKVAEECENGSHPIIVQNTHMKIYEVQPYIDLANLYGYTIIMAITLRKFDVDPKGLAATNRKGLQEQYFKNRLAQWQECNPLYLGWFLGVDDSIYMLKEGQKVLSSLLGDGKFCNIFNVFSEEDIWSYFKARKNLSCVATYCKRIHAKEWGFYLSDLVQDCYGKCFSLIIYGYVITRSCFLAVVSIPPEGKNLVLKQRGTTKKGDDDLCKVFDGLGLSNSDDSVQLTSFSQEFQFDDETAVADEWDNYNELNIKNLNVMILGQCDEYIDCKNAREFLNNIFGEMVNDKGELDISEYAELDDGTEYHRLPNNAWFVRAPQKITVSAVFTGRYL